MKKLSIIVLFIYICLPHSLSQSYANWVNYSFSQRTTGIDINGDDIWISTQGGLVKYNKNTQEKTYYNRANANLPDNNLLGLFCTANGDVWVGGTYYGIGKFTGEQCSIYNQANSGLPFDQLNTQIKVDKNGNVWVASFRWMVKYDGNSWKTWITGSDFSAWPLVSGFDIDNNGVVWLYSTDGIGKIENEEYSIVSTIGSGLIAKFGCVKIDNEGNVWIAIENIGLYKYDGSTFINYSTSNSCLPTNLINSIAFDTENNMWLATVDGLVNFNISDCNIYNIPQIPDDSLGLLTVKCDNNDTIWCGSLSGKLLCFNGADFTSIDLSNSPLKHNYILDIFVDEENNKWIGTKRNAVKKTTTQFYSVFNKQANCFVQDKSGATWIAFATGDTCLLKMDEDESIVFDSLNSPFNTKKVSIRALAVDNNNHIWITTSRHGMFKHDGLSFTNYNIGNSDIPSNEITELAFDAENNLWGGSANGLFKFDDTNWIVWDRTNSTIPTNIVTRLAFDAENKLWFSCMDEDRIVGIEFGGGLTCFDGQTMTTYNIYNSGLLANTIFDIYIDAKDSIWLATCGAGLMCFDKQDNWVSYNVTNSGIANNIVQQVTQDKMGSLWLGHIDAGISVFNPDSLNSSVSKINENNLSFTIFPNPATSEFNISFNLSNKAEVFVTIYDLHGKTLDKTINKTILNAGKKNIKIDVDHLNQGIYFCALIINNKVHVKKLFIH